MDRIRSASRHFARPGDKIGRKLTKRDRDRGATAWPAMDVELQFHREVEGFYGLTTIMEFVVLSGEQKDSVIKWFCSGSFPLDVSSRHQLVATVKKNDEYRGHHQTVVNRAVLKPLEV